MTLLPVSGDNRPPFESRDVTVSDLATLEKSILDQIAAASDEPALEAVRVAALGKKGSISALLATLGKMSPDERKTQGAAINLAKDKVTEALAARREILKSAALDARLASETIDVTLPLDQDGGSAAQSSRPPGFRFCHQQRACRSPADHRGRPGQEG